MNKKYILGVGILIVLLIIASLLSSFSNSDKKEADLNYSTEEYRLDREGISFQYKTEPDGYVAEDMTMLIGEQPTGAELVSVHRLINAREKQELEESEVGREGPPAIFLAVFGNSKNQSASMWIDAFPMFSGIDFVIGDVDRDVVVGGANAVRYMTDGLYQTQNVVIASNGYIYHFSGAYLEKDSDIYKDFNDIIDSVEFIPVVDGGNAPQAKIDPKVACESALIYMSFASGEEADVFVSECIEGKHPEVIERYISDMGLDGRTI